MVNSEKCKKPSVPGSNFVLLKSIDERRILGGVPVFKRKVLKPNSRKDSDKSPVVGSRSGPPGVTSDEIIFTPAIYVPVVTITSLAFRIVPSFNVTPVTLLLVTLSLLAIPSITVRFS